MRFNGLGFSRPRYTLTNKHKVWSRNIKERLDRGLDSPNWKFLFPLAIIKHLPRPCLHNCPIMLICEARKVNCKPFKLRFTIDPNFHDFIRGQWSSAYLASSSNTQVKLSIPVYLLCK